MKHSDKSMINRVRGSMIGGAAGDALGYAVEFMRLGTIKQRYLNQERVSSQMIRKWHSSLQTEFSCMIFTMEESLCLTVCISHILTG